ncbi:MAG: hypothetical protein K5785_03490 [Nitrosarchaeum sp.]|nr:hypothetical protein [Nitrosarchaeum sp.]
MILTLENCAHYLDAIENFVDSEWLKIQTDKIIEYYNTVNNTSILGKLEDYSNPLALLIYQADKTLSRLTDDKHAHSSVELIKAVSLGMYLEKLTEANLDFKDKLTDLTSSDKKSFEKIIFELDIATAFLNSGHSVEFIKTDSTHNNRTADLRIDGTIEVECKKKDKLTKFDIQNQDRWNTLNRKLRAFFNEQKKYPFIYIFVKNDLSHEIIQKILKQIRKMTHNNETAYSDSEIKIMIEELCKNDEIMSLGFQARNSDELMGRINPKIIDTIIKSKIKYTHLMDYELIHPDHFSDDSKIQIVNENVFVSELRRYVFKSLRNVHRMNGIISSIKNARNQLSGDTCGIICVNFTHLTDTMIEQDYKNLTSLINQFLKNNSKVSAVIVSSEFYSTSRDMRFIHKALIIRNPLARHKLPDNFQFLNDVSM